MINLKIPVCAAGAMNTTEQAASIVKAESVARQQPDNYAAMANCQKSTELEPDDYEARGALARAYRESGDLPASEKHYSLAEQMALKDNEVGQACFHAVSGDFAKALDLLEAGVAKGQVLPGWIRIDPEFAFMQDEPRFQALIDPAAAG
jgi:Tfp pilus assembly protein PilF